jgi:hypothetical protein
VEFGDRYQAGIVRGDLHHLNEGVARFRLAVQQMVTAALGAPAAAAEPEETNRIGDR